MEPERLTLQLLQEITDGFSEERKLGEGGYGVVFKVKIRATAYNFLLVKSIKYKHRLSGKHVLLTGSEGKWRRNCCQDASS